MSIHNQDYNSPHGKSHRLYHLSHCTIAAHIPYEQTATHHKLPLIMETKQHRAEGAL